MARGSYAAHRMPYLGNGSEGDRAMAEFELIGRNDARTGVIVANFADGSLVKVEWFAAQAEDHSAAGSRFPMSTWTRQAYRYLVKDAAGHVIDDGEDLSSGCGQGINFLEIMDSWCSFAQADAERYQSAMDGSPIQEWCYLHDDEISLLSEDLKEGESVF